MDMPHGLRHRRALNAVGLVLAVLASLFAFAFESPAGAAEVIDEDCYVPKVNSVEEYRFRVRSELHGEKEIKEIKGWIFGGSEGTVTVAGQTIPGKWSQTSPDQWNVIPDVIINAVWGADGVPDSVLGTGSVNLNTYGGPNQMVQYDAHKITTDEGYTDWSEWSEWSTTDPGPDSELKQVDQRTQPGTGLDEEPFPCPEASASPGTCEAPGEITVSKSEHYTSNIVGDTVTFTAVPPAVFGASVETEFSFPEIAQLEGRQCDDTPPPPPPPTTGVTTTTEATTTTVAPTTSTTEPAEVGGITETTTDSGELSGGTQLPRTGVGVGALLLVAGLLTGLGTIMRGAGRRLR